ncbi:hypothetical protein [Mycoplasma sp. ATU-Cv-508]|uniref:hypothetical protein n=1 Tax=Mycoplasma sp. ATU-Cv-508 TaxID=2048001 RepID=UPI000FDD2E53
MLEQFVDVLKMLNPQLKPKLEIYNNVDILRNYLLGQGTWYSFHGWSPDYAGAGTWLTGLSRERFGIQGLALASLKSNLAESTPTLVDYGKRLSDRITSTISQQFENRPELINVFKSPNQANNFTNAKETSLSSHSLIGDSLLDVQAYQKLPASDRLLVDQARQKFQNLIAKLDFEIQQEVEEQYFVSIFSEYMSLVGNYFGTQAIGLPNKQKPIAKVWQPWLIGTGLKNGVVYLQDYEVN